MSTAEIVRVIVDGRCEDRLIVHESDRLSFLSPAKVQNFGFYFSKLIGFPRNARLLPLRASLISRLLGYVLLNSYISGLT